LKIIGFIVVISTGLLLLYAESDFPDWADPSSPASVHVSPHYITESVEETSVPNIVTAVLADYRSYDTMFETVVVFAAGIAVYSLLRRSRKRQNQQEEQPVELPHQALIVKTVCRLMIPFMQIFALYVIAHGHHSPGGGFQGGVILGASFILLAISHDIQVVIRRFKEKTNLIFIAIGILLYSTVGVAALLFKLNFLDYSYLSFVIPVLDSVTARSIGILVVEIGVAVTVMSAMILIYTSLSSRGTYESGL